MVLAKEKFGLRGREVAEPHAKFVPFHRADAHERRRFRGARWTGRELAFAKARRRPCRDYVESLGGVYPTVVAKSVDEISKRGGNAARRRAKDAKRSA